MLLAGKHAVITGALQGIGKATVEAFAKQGANVFACCQHEDAQFFAEMAALAEACNVTITPVISIYWMIRQLNRPQASFRKVKCP